MASILHRSGPFEERNPRLFVWFTTLYNARAYYPILAVFFTDLGLSLDQYVLLNAVWAASIFLLEVPSGALADTLGRKRLLVFSAAVMVVEIGVLLVAPDFVVSALVYFAGVALTLGVFGKSLVLMKAHAIIADAGASGLPPHERNALIERRGGIDRLSTIVAMLFLAGVNLAIFFRAAELVGAAG